jgi:hypothetical protein
LEAVSSTVKIIVNKNGEKVIQLIESTSDDDSVRTNEKNHKSNKINSIPEIQADEESDEQETWQVQGSPPKK